MSSETLINIMKYTNAKSSVILKCINIVVNSRVYLFYLHTVHGMSQYLCPSCDVYKLLESMHYNLFII